MILTKQDKKQILSILRDRANRLWEMNYDTEEKDVRGLIERVRMLETEDVLLPSSNG